MAKREFVDCPKCGEDDPIIEYRENNVRLSCTESCPREEHFHVRCFRCEYSWKERLEQAKPTGVSDSSEDEFPIIEGVGRMTPILPPKKYILSNKDDTRITNG